MDVDGDGGRREFGLRDQRRGTERTSRISFDGFRSVGRVPLMTCQGMDSPQTPHRDAELLRYLHLHRGGPMEAIPVGVLPGQLSRSPVNPVPVSRLLLWSPFGGSLVSTPSKARTHHKPQFVDSEGIRTRAGWVSSVLPVFRSRVAPRSRPGVLRTERTTCGSG